MSTVSRNLSDSTNHESLADRPADRLWRSPAPAAVKQAADAPAAWAAWRDHLASRGRPSGFDPLDLPAGSLAPIAWGTGAGGTSASLGDFADWLATLGKGLAGKRSAARLEADAVQWASEAAERAPSVRFALEAVAWAHALPRLASSVEAPAWWALGDQLATLARDSHQLSVPAGADPSSAVIEQLLAGELPLALGRLLPEVLPLHELAASARESLSEGLLRLTDGEGLLPAPIVAAPLTSPDKAPAAALLLACWTRCHAIGTKKNGKNGAWSADAQVQYEWLIRQSLRLVDRQGRYPFTESKADNLALLEAALDLAGDLADDAAAAKRLKTPRETPSCEPPTPSNHSEWSELGVLAAGWRDKAPRIVVAHPGQSMAIEVRAGKQVLFSGEWPVEATVNGQPLRATDEWETQCWYSDEDCDYLELSLPLAGPKGDMRLERQIMLSRNDGVAMLSDLLMSEDDRSPSELSLTTTLPLAGGVSFNPAKETREGVLSVGDKPVAGVVPLSLPEWRDDPRGGELVGKQSADGDVLRLTRQATGRNLASPLWIDFSASRFGKQVTWRQLTVAQSLEVVDHDVAVGYRVQAGKDQWIAYRSLDEPANRTLLGHNLSSECLVGRFLSTGEVDEYFEIEAE